MAKALALLLLFQHLDVAPFPAESGAEVRITALDGSGRPLGGLRLQVTAPDGSRSALPPTDAAGRAVVQAGPPGDYVYAAEVAGVEVLAPHVVVPARRRWLYALACVPLGLILLWRHLLHWPGRAPAVSAGPSRPAP